MHKEILHERETVRSLVSSPYGAGGTLRRPVSDLTLERLRAAVHSSDRALSPLEKAVYAAIAYREPFDFAPTIAEIHRYLPFVECTLEEVEAALGGNESRLSGSITTDGTYFALKGREGFFGVREERERRYLEMSPSIRRYARIVASLPFVRMVALTGSLAARNPDASADIDLLIITRAGHMWRVRTLTGLIRRLDRALDFNVFCPNVIRTEAALELEVEGLYIAQELMQMVPLYGYDVYLQMIRANGWTREVFPNALALPRPHAGCPPYSHALKRAVELLTSNPFGNWFDEWRFQVRSQQFSRPDHELYHYTRFHRERDGLDLRVAHKIEASLMRQLASAFTEAGERAFPDLVINQ